MVNSGIALQILRFSLSWQQKWDKGGNSSVAQQSFDIDSIQTHHNTSGWPITAGVVLGVSTDFLWTLP